MPRSAPHVVAISGSVRRPSRSRALCDAVAAALSDRMEIRYTSYDLVDAGPGLGAAFGRDDLTDDARRVLEAIEDADALVAISPVYKGSYTGLFKHLFDFVSPASLLNKPVVIGATGGGHRHGLVVEHQLRPLFGFFSALTVPTSVYASDQEFADNALVEPAVRERVDQAAAQLAALLLSRSSRTAQGSVDETLRASAA